MDGTKSAGNIEREITDYEQKVDRLHQIAERLEKNLRPLLEDELPSTEGKSNPQAPSQILRDLDKVINHFEYIVNRIRI